MLLLSNKTGQLLARPDVDSIINTSIACKLPHLQSCSAQIKVAHLRFVLFSLFCE